MENPNYFLAYDKPNGQRCVVFHVFNKRPSTKEMVAAVEKQSEFLGYNLKTSDLWFWGPVDGKT